MTTMPCGCVNEDIEEFGVKRCVAKCIPHWIHAMTDRERPELYYPRLVDNDNDTRASELFGTLRIPDASLGDRCLEVGCGCSPYVSVLRARGYQYVGTDSCRWAVDWMNRTYGKGTAFHVPVESSQPSNVSMILACHVLEHVVDPVHVLSNLCNALLSGGRLVVIVPDDRDLTNPDHLWFFNAEGLHKMITAAGFTVTEIHQKSIIAREDFIFCTALRVS